MRDTSRLTSLVALAVIGGFAVLVTAIAPGAFAESPSTDARRPPSELQAMRVTGLSVPDDMSEARVALSDTAGVEVAAAGAEVRVTSSDVRPALHLDDARATVQTIDVTLKRGPEQGTVSLSYYSRAYYEQVGAPQAPVLIMSTTLSRTGRDPHDSFYPSVSPRGEDKTSANGDAWAAARASGQVPEIDGDLGASVRAFYQLLDASNDPSSGQLCSDSLSGIDTLRSISSRSCYVWCTGYARMTRGFLRSAGIPARMISLEPQRQTLSNGVLVQSSEAHATVEWWDGARWVWIGPTWRVLRAVEGPGGPLSVAGLIAALAEPSRREQVVFTRLDPTTGTWRTAGWDEQDAAFRQAMLSEFSADKALIVMTGTSQDLQPLIAILVVVASGSLAVATFLIWRRRASGRSRPAA